jgi:hypothetical protein
MVIILIFLFILYLLFLCIAYNWIEAQELRKELDIDSEECNVYIDGKWYSESEVIAMVHEMQDKIKELEKSNEFYLEHIRRHKVDDKEVYD